MGVPDLLFPFGDYSVVWDMNTDEISEGFHSHRDTIRKTSGSDVKTDVFESDVYNEICPICVARLRQPCGKYRGRVHSST